ncbi:short-chain fatty acyl-CoA regulator family protein [Sphingomonas sp. KR1UV-12]|uniref:Short-chain fatty acyl-CoA regulator family protein n=1 Tax=Sphingomonas aurea TaxID=3063994 RepID=A0ABT9EF64_9SPHN|nr:helix-turn-helix transcriptional regulator [Sphingomonas sp. KR1UV-12]MDP1025599.1 short-chain fatty acyl-CoA regulator family protein [Sphingomonas sp. KR1UV-12]
MATPRLYAGEQLRALRVAAGLNQRAMAARLGLSVSYLSQLEGGERPLTAAVTAALARHYPHALAGIEGQGNARRLAALHETMADPALAPLGADATIRLAEERPEIADRLIALHAAKRAAEERLALAEETLVAGGSARLPWEAVRDWFHAAGNYIDPLDRAAEALAASLNSSPKRDPAKLEGYHGLVPGGPPQAATPLRQGVALPPPLAGEELEAALGTHDIAVATDPDPDAPLARTALGTLVLNGALAPESRRFQLAHRLAATAFARIIADVVTTSGLDAPDARHLLEIGLANYAAGALLMPYAAFRSAARAVRHDIDLLSRRFGVSFEQACHRLSTLQRPGAAGIPFYFCRVDMAGNITKRHSATRLQFARFGGACPLWHVHEAAAIPDRILVQHAETPDGVRYISMAKGLVKPSGRFTRLSRRYAVVLGCEAIHAADFVYADAVDRAGAPTPIGISCRLCPRPDCDQRAFPPADRRILVDPLTRNTVPYRVI